ncbi:MAG: PSD1 and planctomycete cytochrome C domain-containing protein [Planctomycetota bacterium]
MSHRWLSRSTLVVAMMVTTPHLVFSEALPPVDFDSEIRPLFEAHCVDCHGPDESNGGLRLDSRQSAFATGDSGKHTLVPGNADASELLARVLTTDVDTQMPPDGPRLSPKDIENLTRWIAQGADWPQTDGQATEPQTAAETHWSFQALTDPEVPFATADAWSAHPIDRFLHQSRVDQGLPISQDADARAVFRRLHFNLIGLPPSPEQVQAFLQRCMDRGLDRAIAEAVDVLLAQPQYGERWGRHWMDWVRYADTAGDNSDYPIPQAYLYRNYIIDAFNQDTPYDQFLMEQIAGDLLPAENLEQRNRQTIATGYLAMARRFGSLVERYPWHLTIEDTIDNMGKTMLGMTIACARCHDHKFDPVSTRDYYGLYGFFASTNYPFPGIELFKAQHRFVSLLPAKQTQAHLKPFEEKTQELEQELDHRLAVANAKGLDNAKLHGTASIAEQRRMREEHNRLLGRARKAGEALAKHLREIPELPSAYAVSEGTPTDAAVQIKGEPTRPGAIIPRRFPDVLGGYELPDDAASGSGRLELARWIASKRNPLTARVIVNRVWERHFGRGIVSSTTDFGIRGHEPDHPDLLDWLARDFIKHGWSIKHLHRTILTSRSYRLSADTHPDLKGRDPENKCLTHQRRSRLDAESIRDSILQVTGNLDTRPHNEPHPFPERTEWEFTQHHPFKDSYTSNRRSVYLMTKRLTADRYFQTFDGPDRNVCTQSRDQSITALQALYFVNNEFLHEQADQLARRLPSDADDRILNDMFQRILQRNPTPTERAWLGQHLNTTRSMISEHQTRVSEHPTHEAWASVIRSLFRLNEFLYID